MNRIKKAGLAALAGLTLFAYSALPLACRRAGPAPPTPKLEIDYQPPAVNLKWEPTKIINDKVEEIKVDIVAKDEESHISKVALEFEPVVYHLPIQAFPPETPRIFEPIPLDENFDENEEEFSVKISEIKGGREYLIKAKVYDEAGNITLKEIKTPYLREFENIAPLDDILIGAYYYPWYSKDRHWKEGYKGTPLLGEYESRDPIIISKHIDWATGYGIDFFLFSWWGPGSFEDLTIKDYFLKNTLASDIKFQILYESAGRLRGLDFNDPNNKKILLSDFDYLIRTYFDNPQFLKIKDRYPVTLYLSREFKGNVKEALDNLRKQANKKGYNLFLIGDLVYWQDASMEKDRIKLYDAVTAYNMHTSVPDILDDFENNLAKKYDEWLKITKELGVGFMPSVLPGFDDRAVRTGNIPLQKNTQRFEKQVEIATSYMDELKIFLITTFNEWHEYTAIEPSYEDGYKYLLAVKNL